MKILQGDGWKRRGMNLLWGSATLASIAPPEEIMSIRQFFNHAKAWPEDLPSSNGTMAVVAGLEGCIDLLLPQEAEEWLRDAFRPAVSSFEEAFGLGASLIFWLPTGRKRIHMNAATEAYSWSCALPHGHERLDLGNALWAGAESDVQRIIDPACINQDVDGPAWIGLHHTRLS